MSQHLIKFSNVVGDRSIGGVGAKNDSKVDVGAKLCENNTHQLNVQCGDNVYIFRITSESVQNYYFVMQ